MKGWKTILWNFTKWTLVLSYLIAALAFVKTKSNETPCSSIHIEVADSLHNAFVTKKDILKTIEKKNPNLIGTPLSAINTFNIENQLASLQSVKKVVAYKTANGKLAVSVQQRKPMVRVFNRNGQSYYIDNEGLVLPLSNSYTSHVLVINGNITEPFPIESNTEVMHWTEENAQQPLPLICNLFEFAQYITSDPFWSAQITQIYVDSPTDIELIPRVGPHVVLLGDLNDYKTKLKKLKLFYEQALPEEGWNKYKLINLKYRNQVVCTKR